LPQTIYTWYTDGSSFLHEGAIRASCSIVSDTEAQALPAHTTNQQAEVVVLIHAFQLAQGQTLNRYKIEIIACILSDYHGLRLVFNNNNSDRKLTYTWKLNDILLNDNLVMEKIKK